MVRGRKKKEEDVPSQAAKLSKYRFKIEQSLRRVERAIVQDIKATGKVNLLSLKFYKVLKTIHTLIVMTTEIIEPLSREDHINMLKKTMARAREALASDTMADLMSMMGALQDEIISLADMLPSSTEVDTGELFASLSGIPEEYGDVLGELLDKYPDLVKYAGGDEE